MASPLVVLGEPDPTGSGASLGTAEADSAISQPGWLLDFVGDKKSNENEFDQFVITPSAHNS
jgi:hypothetical protein